MKWALFMRMRKICIVLDMKWFPLGRHAASLWSYPHGHLLGGFSEPGLQSHRRKRQLTGRLLGSRNDALVLLLRQRRSVANSRAFHFRQEKDVQERPVEGLCPNCVHG